MSHHTMSQDVKNLNWCTIMCYCEGLGSPVLMSLLISVLLENCYMQEAYPRLPNKLHARNYKVLWVTSNLLSSCWKVNNTKKTSPNKKAFQSNANRPLSNSLCVILNKFERVRGTGWAGSGACMGGWWQGQVQRPPPPWTEWQTDTTENITFPQRRWRAVTILFVWNTRLKCSWHMHMQ